MKPGRSCGNLNVHVVARLKLGTVQSKRIPIPVTQPNILMITCHDIGQHLGCYGVDSVNTPNLDGLAAKGVRFSRFYSTSSVCSPARGSLHTGRYPQSNGLMGLTHAPWWWSLNADEQHTAALLRKNGYATHLIGFNHIDGANWERLGYDAWHSRSLKAEETVDATRDVIEQAETVDKPFFAKVGFSEVHRAFTHGTDDSRGVFIPPWLQDTPAVREDLAAFQATIRYFDERVGEILRAVEESGIADNTLIIMTSDHGMPYPGAKWTVRKAGIEVPFIAYKPNSAFSGGRVLDDIVSNVDVLPSLLEYIGAGIPECIQGRSFMSLVQGNASGPPRTEACAQYTPDMKRDNLSRCIITDRYHLIRYFDQGRTVDYPVAVHPQTFAHHEERCKTKGTRPFVQLFDLLEDPYELHDIGSDPENSAVVADLSKKLLRWMREVDDPLLDGPLKTPYYEKAMADFTSLDE